ncbi:MAG TPA: HPr family phosphocarrier protein, partial [Thermodesulfobacteriota bacterium]|nr:HPr family phosphocarrier protein [Thermodesulfobacteriota bacterium]
AKVVNHYGSDVVMKVGSDTFDAKSVLNITWAGGKIAREKIKSVTFVGDKRTLRDLEILASVNYGEDRMGKDQPLPKELSYLR